MVMHPKNFFLIFSRNVAFFEKIVNKKNIWYLISHKKRLYSFSLPDAPYLQKRLGPQKRVFAVFLENTAFFETTAK